MKATTGSTPPASIDPITTAVSATFSQKFPGLRSCRRASGNSRRAIGSISQVPPRPSRLDSRRPSHQATTNTKARPKHCTGINGRNNSAAGMCSAAEARIIGPVHGKKFTPAASDATQARIRRSIPILS